MSDSGLSSNSRASSLAIRTSHSDDPYGQQTSSPGDYPVSRAPSPTKHFQRQKPRQGHEDRYLREETLDVERLEVEHSDSLDELDINFKVLDYCVFGSTTPLEERSKVPDQQKFTLKDIAKMANKLAVQQRNYANCLAKLTKTQVTLLLPPHYCCCRARSGTDPAVATALTRDLQDLQSHGLLPKRIEGDANESRRFQTGVIKADNLAGARFTIEAAISGDAFKLYRRRTREAARDVRNALEAAIRSNIVRRHCTKDVLNRKRKAWEMEDPEEQMARVAEAEDARRGKRVCFKIGIDQGTQVESPPSEHSDTPLHEADDAAEEPQEQTKAVEGALQRPREQRHTAGEEEARAIGGQSNPLWKWLSCGGRRK